MRGAIGSASWLKRVDDQGPDALVQLPQPVNRFPAFVRYLVQRLKTLCPRMGKMKIAQTLGRRIAAAGKAPKHLVCDKVGQFFQGGFRTWCRR